MKITYVHHSAFLADLSSATLLFDYTQGTLPDLDTNKPLFCLRQSSPWRSLFG